MNARTVLPVAGVALVAAIVGVFLVTGDGGVPTSIDGSDDSVASIDGDMEVESLARDVAAATAVDGKAAHASVDGGARRAMGNLAGRRWSDLIRPIDDATRAAIADAWIVHLAPDGERRRIELTDAVCEDDLLEGALLAIDAASHLYRPFWPPAIDRDATEPLDVRLHASARLGFDVTAPTDGRPYRIPVRVRVDVDAPEVVAIARALGFGDEGRGHMALALGEKLAACFVDERSDAMTRSTNLLMLRPIVDTLPFDRLDGPPPGLPRGGSFGLEPGRSTPLTDLDASVPLVVDAAASSLNPRYRVRGSDTWTSAGALDVAFGEARSVTIDVDVLGATRVRARVEGPVAYGWAWTTPDKIVDGLRTTERGRPQGQVLVADSGTLELQYLAPGDHVLRVEWTGTDGIARALSHPFHLEPGEELDLGLLRPSGTATLRIHVQAFVDGRDSDVARFPDPIRLSCAPAGGERAREFNVVGGAQPVGVGGLELGAYELTVELPPVQPNSPGGPRSNLVSGAPSNAAPDEGLRLVGARLDVGSRIVLDGDATVRLTVEFERVTRAILEVRVADGAGGLSYGEPVDIVAWSGTGSRFRHSKSVPLQYVAVGGEPVTCLGLDLQPGRWTVAVRARNRVAWVAPPSPGTRQSSGGGVVVEGANGPLIGAVEFDVGPSDPVRVDVVLEPSATVHATVRDHGGTLGRGAAVVPVGWPDAAAVMWFEGDGPVGLPVSVLGCLPSTAYRVLGTDRSGTTGGAGSVIDLTR